MMAPTHLDNSNIEVPSPEDLSPVAGGYTGFNGLDLQQIYDCRALSATRDQIARGWGKPIVQQLPNGTFLATGFRSLRKRPNPKYPHAHEEAALFFSADARHWSSPRLLNIPGRPVQATVLSDGRIILATYDAWGPANQIYYSNDDATHFTPACVQWNKFVADTRPNVQCGFGETNGILELKNGTLLAVACIRHDPIDRYTDFQAYLIRSTDRGRTWSDASPIIETDEVELLLLPDGQLLGFVRLDTSYTRDMWGVTDAVGEGGDQMALVRSDDMGHTWSKPTLIGLGAAQVPAFPLLLPDGRLMLIYGNRRFPFGVQAIASDDRGQTWRLDRFLMLAIASWDNYGGHPRSILLSDGSILTGYYARYFKTQPDPDATVDDDLVSHTLRWQPPSDWP